MFGILVWLSNGQTFWFPGKDVTAYMNENNFSVYSEELKYKVGKDGYTQELLNPQKPIAIFPNSTSASTSSSLGGNFSNSSSSNFKTSIFCYAKTDSYNGQAIVITKEKNLHSKRVFLFLVKA